MKWLAVLDMDGTILEERSIDVLCDKLGFTENLKRIDEQSKSLKEFEISAKVAKLFYGVRATAMEKIFEGISIVKGAKEFVEFLKSRGFVTAIITDSYTFLASNLAQRLGIDIVRGNELEFIDGVATGAITMPLGWEKIKRIPCQQKAICKLQVLNDLISKYSIKAGRTLAVGDSQSDFCIIQEAGIGVAFRPKSGLIVKAADVVIHTDFYYLIDWLKNFLEGVIIN